MNNRDYRQRSAATWAAISFGASNATSASQRALKFLEEAVELYQAAGGDLATGHRLLDFVFGRPVGEIEQELGGAGLTLLLLANAAGLSADDAERLELDRVLSKSASDFAKKDREKLDAGIDLYEGSSQVRDGIRDNGEN